MKSTSLRKIKQKLKFLNSFQKMTKSVSLISAVRYRRAQQKISQIVLVGYYLLSMLNGILKRHEFNTNMLTNKHQFKDKLSKFVKVREQIRENSCILVIVIGSDRGLAGAFDLNIFQKANLLIREFREKSIRENPRLDPRKSAVLVGTVGRKAESYFKRREKLLFSFSKFEDLFPESFAVELVSYLQFLIDQEKLDRIIIVKPNLTSAGYVVETITVYPFSLEFLEETIKSLLPKTKEYTDLHGLKTQLGTDTEYSNKGQRENLRLAAFDYLLEPNPEELMTVLLKQVSFLVVYITILQAQASLELARTITMRKAFDNSTDLIRENMLEYNKLRQSKITQELLDIIR